MVAVKDDAERLNFNFSSADITEAWCLGPRRSSDDALSPHVGDRVIMYGDWITDASGNRVYFHAVRVIKSDARNPTDAIAALVEEVIDLRLGAVIRADPVVKEMYPAALRTGAGKPFVHVTDRLLVVAILDSPQFEDATRRKREQQNPLPGFIVLDPGPADEVAVQLQAKFIALKGCQFLGVHSFAASPDSSAVIFDHRYLPPNGTGDAKEIPLAYIVAFGKELQVKAAPQILDDLIAYSFRLWRSRYASA